MQHKYSTWVILAKAFFFEEIEAWNPFYPDLRIYSFYSVLWLSGYVCSHLTHQYLLNSHYSQTLYCLLENVTKRLAWSNVLLWLGRSMYCFGVWVLQGWAVERTRPGSGANTCSVTSRASCAQLCLERLWHLSWEQASMLPLYGSLYAQSLKLLQTVVSQQHMSQSFIYSCLHLFIL